MNKLTLYITSFLVISLFAFQADDVILWSPDYELKWSDFQGKPPNNLGFKKAAANCRISIISDYYKGELPSYEIKSLFGRQKSWSVTKNKNSLIHERLHFDITELHSRKIREEISKLNNKNELNPDCYKKAYRKILGEHKIMQEVYDKEVYFDLIKQNEWIKKIHEELEELKDYQYIE